MAFRIRHLGNNLKTINNMLSKQSRRDVDSFIEHVIPSSIYLKTNTELKRPQHIHNKTEKESLKTIKNYFDTSNQNNSQTIFQHDKGLNDGEPIKYMIGMDLMKARLQT